MVSIKLEFSIEGKETKEHVMIIAEEWSKKLASLKIENHKQLVLLKSSLHDDKCKDMSFRQKLSFIKIFTC